MSYKVLGQSAPAADTDTTLYTVPASTETVVSSITVCNRGNIAAKFRVAVRPNGAAIADQHYIYYDVAISAYSTFVFTGGITMDASDVVTVRGDTANFSFNLFGKEVSV